MGRPIDIRDERPDDAGAITAIIETAFAGLAHSQGTEARIVEALRAADALTLSLVAVRPEEVIGHVAFSPVTIAGAERWFGLGPVAVLPDAQGSGVGSALIREGLARLKAIGAGGCVLLGNPAYYSRFGFAIDPGLTYKGASAPYFQRLVIAGPDARGDVAFHPAFDTR